MNPKSPLPRTRSSQYWLNLALACLLLFYILFEAWQALTPGMFGIEIANDYGEYIRGGTRANTYDFAWITEWRLQGRPPVSGEEWAGMLPYPPVFTVPFQLLAFLDPRISYWIWIAINLATLYVYLRFFARRLNLQLPARLMTMVFAGLPVFHNLWLGQVNVWLLICVGELLRALLEQKPFKAGMWIGGLLLKPQILILIGLLLLVQRAWKIIAGLAVTSSVVGLVSFLLVGPGGFFQIWRSWTQAAQAPVSEWVEGMMNWRMIDILLSTVTSAWVGLAVAIVGMLITAGLCLYAWRRSFYPAPRQYISVGILGLLTATALVSWHSQIHMAMIFIPPILYLYLTGRLPQKVMQAWFLWPALLFVATVFGPETLMFLKVIPLSARVVIWFLLGASEFSLNLFLFFWALRESRQAVMNVAPSISLA